MPITILIPIIATLAGTCAMIYTKYLMKRKRVGYLAFTVQSFWAIMLVLLPGILLMPPLPTIPVHYILLFVLLAAIACFWNVMFYHGFKEETLVESQLVVMLVPLVAALSGFAFFQDERKLSTIIFLTVGIAAIAWSHITHHKLHFHSGSWLILIASVFIAIESVLVKILLPVFTVYWLYFTRVAAVTFILTLIFPKAAKPEKSTALHILAIGALVALQFVLTYWSYAVYGIVFSNLIFSLLPFLTASAGHFIFHERVSQKQLIAGIVLIACVLVAQLF